MKEELANRIKRFMYASDLPIDSDSDLKLVSNTYLKAVLMPAYSDNSRIEPYTIIAGDFNKLNLLNKQYGLDESNRCICKCLEIISHELPSDAIISRYAGDEFLFILPSVSDKQMADTFISKINKSISNSSDDIHGLSISLASACSSEAPSLAKMYDISDKEVFGQKPTAKKFEVDPSVQDFYETLDTFFSAMRFSKDYKFTNSNLNKIVKHTWDNSFGMINSYHNFGNLGYSPKEISHSKDVDMPFYHFSQDAAHAIDEAFLTHSDSLGDLSKVPNSDLEFLSNSLVFNSSSRAYSKEYFLDFLKDHLDNDQKYNLFLFSLSGLKLSNLLNGHLATDNLLYSSYAELDDSVSKFASLNLSPFTANPSDSFKIDLRGGDLFFITPEDTTLPVQDILREINSNNDILRYIVCSSKKPVSLQDISSFIRTAKSRSDSLKDDFKESLINSPSLDAILNYCLSNDVLKYCQDHPTDYYKTKNIQTFLIQQANVVYGIVGNFLAQNQSFISDGEPSVDLSLSK